MAWNSKPVHIHCAQRHCVFVSIPKLGSEAVYVMDGFKCVGRRCVEACKMPQYISRRYMACVAYMYVTCQPTYTVPQTVGQSGVGPCWRYGTSCTMETLVRTLGRPTSPVIKRIDENARTYPVCDTLLKGAEQPTNMAPTWDLKPVIEGAPCRRRNRPALESNSLHTELTFCQHQFHKSSIFD